MPIDRFQTDPACRVLVFTSPKAGSGFGREQVPRLIEMIEAAGIDCVAVHTTLELRRELEKSVGQSAEAVIVAAGGDGTLALAAATARLEEVGSTGSILPMPLGTENLLARQFGHTAVADSVVKTIRHGAIYRLDAGMANTHPFLIMATCGFDAEVVRGMHLTRRGHIRRLSYLGPIVRAMRQYKFPGVHVRIDGGDPIDCCWAMVFNLPRYGGGLRIEPGAIGNDGQLDVILFQRGSILSGLKYACGIWLGRHLKMRDVIRLRGERIEINSEGRVPFQLDGDYSGRLPLRIELKPDFVRLLLPPV